LAYQESLRFAEKIVEDEESRRFQLQIQLLEDDNNDLQEQLSMEDRRIDELEAECGALQGDLELSESSLRQFQNDLRARDRELNKLRVSIAQAALHYCELLTISRLNFIL
jgi:chromosome segregation ATPase